MSNPALRKYRLTLRNLVSPDKTRVKTVEAAAENAAYAIGDAEKGWEVTGVSDMGPATSAFSLTLFQKKTNSFPDKDLIRFCKGMATMLKAGISTVDSLNFYAGNLPQKHLQAVLRKISHEIEMGEHPDVAFARTGMFSNVFVGLVKAGVASGDLGGALTQSRTK